MKRTIYFNEDNHHFYGKHPPEDMSLEGIRRLVDFYAENTQVAGILFCVNVQRALFDSKVWETFWDGYDPALGDDQPTLRRTHGVKNHLLLRERGLDQHAIWLERCRHHGIEGWLTMRMNDCHGLKETFLHMQGEKCPNGESDWALHWPSQFWREHPELRRAPYRLERSWEGAFDYGKAEVREHHMSLIRELFERYDMFGFELDWMRWGMYFAPGHEQAGKPLLTEFVREVRKLADAAEKRLGHPIRLAHRLPANPEACLALGFDPITWAREGLADMVTLSGFSGGSNLGPIPIWRAMLGDGVKLLVLPEGVVKPCPEHTIEEYEFLYGAAASALERGADGIYLFNQNYRETGEPELLTHILQHAGSLETLAGCKRRHPVTYPQVGAPGDPIRNVLPIPLRVPRIGCNFGRMEENITLRINTGPKPENGSAVLVLGFSGTPPGACDQIEVRLNTATVQPGAEPEYESISETFRRAPRHGWASDFLDAVRFFELPLDKLFAGANVIEIMPPQVEGTLEWAEIVILPEKKPA
jgi:hypothetical protein